MRSIGEYAFTCCWNLRTAQVQSGQTHKLERCFGSETILLPAKQTMVGNRMLWNLRKVKEVQFPADLQEIGESWLADTEIEKVVIPASVRTIRKWAFAECGKL